MSASVTHSDADGDADAHADRFIETTDKGMAAIDCVGSARRRARY
jgi:hypothetical protein